VKTALLAVESLDVRYGAIQALRGVSFAVHAGEIVTLIGSNGAGKSTLLRAVSGLVRPSAGRIRLEGVDVTGSARVDRPARLLPRARGRTSQPRVLENLQMGLPEARWRAAGLGASSPLSRLRERLEQPAGTLSGGEQQMLAIGRALMAEPRLLLCDEPSLGLAPLLVQQIFGILREINRQGTTVVLVEQNARQALRVAQRAYVLETGALALAGAAADLARDPRVREAYLGEAGG
jgi:branched-chain amino acid transport system ATP-binding protein